VVTKTANQKYPSCIGKMYGMGEEYMCANCMGCRAFNKCKDIGYGVDSTPVSIRIPAEPARDIEYAVKW